MGAQDISWLHLAMGYILLIIPITISSYYKMGLAKDSIVSVLRMTIQLLLVGVYLEFIFQLDNPFINLAWVAIMLSVTTYTILQRSNLKQLRFFAPVWSAIFISILVVDFFLLYQVLDLKSLTDARYLIPITGMLIGNTLADIVTSMNIFYTNIDKQKNTYRYALANGATQGEALNIFMRDAMKVSMNRGLASTAVMGLVSLPGMMTGQILGGSSPSIAIKYQILIVITIFVSSSASVFLTLLFTKRKAIDQFGNLRKEIFKK